MKKFIAKYVVIVALLTCAFACISGVSAEEIVTVGASTSGKISLKCGEKSSWRNTTASTDCNTALTKVTRVSCSTTLADATARLVVDDMTVSASTTSKKRTVEAVYNFTITYPNTNHKHNYTAYYG